MNNFPCSTEVTYYQPHTVTDRIAQRRTASEAWCIDATKRHKRQKRKTRCSLLCLGVWKQNSRASSLAKSLSYTLYNYIWQWQHWQDVIFCYLYIYQLVWVVCQIFPPGPPSDAQLRFYKTKILKTCKFEDPKFPTRVKTSENLKATKKNPKLIRKSKFKFTTWRGESDDRVRCIKLSPVLDHLVAGSYTLPYG